MKMTARTHQGLVRINNEDCVHCDSSGGYAVLADGMGGLLAGEEASGVAVASVKACLRNARGSGDPAEALLHAHAEVMSHAQDKNYVGKMGTTLTIWVWADDGARFAHVGDSRLYSFADGNLMQLSHDHTVAQRMVDEGLLTVDEAHHAPNRHVLTQALGMPGRLQPDVGETPANGRMMLCSDGLSDMVGHAEIARLMAEPEVDVCADLLVRAALDHGGRDNVSVIVIDLD